jgi:hypothetical protein
MNHYAPLSLTNRKSSVHLHALYSHRTALRTFAPRRYQLVICGLYVRTYVRVYVACCTVKMLEQKLLTSNNRRSEIQRKRRNAKLRVQHFETFTQIPEFTPSCGVISDLTDYLFIFEGHCIPKLQTELWRHGCLVECPGNSQRLRHLPWVRHEIRRVLCRYPKLVAPSWLQAAQLQLWL